MLLVYYEYVSHQPYLFMYCTVHTYRTQYVATSIFVTTTWEPLAPPGSWENPIGAGREYHERRFRYAAALARAAAEPPDLNERLNQQIRERCLMKYPVMVPEVGGWSDAQKAILRQRIIGFCYPGL